ncbi:MAG: hypothetical protein JO161_05475 [Planctomycetaceae bacterium]|nr:hypothetical protein [Planctomycetaceae bacterium]
MLGPDIDPPGCPIDDRESDRKFNWVPGPKDSVEAAERPIVSEDVSLEELTIQLENDPGECERAFEGLQAIDEPVREQIVEELAKISSGPGILRLLHLLAAAGLGPTSQAAARAVRLRELRGPDDSMAAATEPEANELNARSRALARQSSETGDSKALSPAESWHRPQIMHTVVTAVDGEGRGSIGLSVSQHGRRYSAVFLCDVTQGVVDAMGEVEEERSEAGSLLRDLSSQAGRLAVEDVPELALGFLAGSLTLSGSHPYTAVSDWLERTVGPGFQPSPLPAAPAEPELESVPSSDLTHHAVKILNSCPSWLDSSRLTFEMGEEVFLREGSVVADPRRDAGVFRFLFEHRIIDRLELYRRILLWMAWFWQCARETELARSAGLLARGLMDEQFAVPSHPFAVALMARSLDAAREKLGTQDDPRTGRRKV